VNPVQSNETDSVFPVSPVKFVGMGMPKSSIQGWQTVGYNRCPCIHELETMAWQVAESSTAQPTGYRPSGLDFGIPAEMTA